MLPIDKNTAALLNRDLQVAIRSVATRHGMDLRSCKLTFGPTFARIRAEVAGALDGGAPIADTAALDFDRRAALLGLGHVARGELVTLPDGKTYAVVGLKPRAKVRQVIVERDGRQYMVSVSDIVTAMRKATPGNGAGGIQ
jgi:hypothetical protein